MADLIYKLIVEIGPEIISPNMSSDMSPRNYTADLITPLLFHQYYNAFCLENRSTQIKRSLGQCKLDVTYNTLIS